MARQHRPASHSLSAWRNAAIMSAKCRRAHARGERNFPRNVAYSRQPALMACRYIRIISQMKRCWAWSSYRKWRSASPAPSCRRPIAQAKSRARLRRPAMSATVISSSCWACVKHRETAAATRAAARREARQCLSVCKAVILPMMTNEGSYLTVAAARQRELARMLSAAWWALRKEID